MAIKTEEQLRREILEADHEAKLLSLDELKETSAERKQRKNISQQIFSERQAGFRNRDNAQQKRFNECPHLQGGSLNDPNDADPANPSALTVMRMPDDFTKIVSCIVCKGWRATPHPYLQRKTAFPKGFHMANGIVLERDETPAEVRARLAKFKADSEEFETLLKQSRKKKTKVPDMDCGTVHILTNTETGEKVYPWRPFDVWPYVKVEEEGQRRAA